MKEFAGAEGDVNQINQEAAVRWIIQRDPKFFAKTMPFVGYVDFLWETSLPGETRLKQLKVSATYSRGGARQIPEPYEEEGPWRFPMTNDRLDDDSQTLELSETDDGKTVQVKAGTPIIVRLAGNPTTGYGWETVAVKGDAVKQTGEPDFRDDPAPPD